MARVILIAAVVTLVSSSFVVAQTPALSLESAVQLFLDRNVEVQAARYSIDRARAELIVASVRPNPVLSVIAENLVWSGNIPFDRLYEVGATYTETIELGGKRRLRQSIADLGLSSAEAEFENVLRGKLGEVKRSYFEALLARDNVEIALENRDTSENLLRLNAVRFEEGVIAEGDLLKVRLERVKFDSSLRRAQLALSHAMINLLEKLEEPDFGVRPLSGSLDTPLLNLDLDRLNSLALETRPDLRAADVDIMRARELSALERARTAPDLSPYVGYKRVASNNTLTLGIIVPLRFRDRNQGGIARAGAVELIAQGRREVVENSVRVEVELAFRSYEAARDQVTTFREQLLRQADESQAITLASYEEGATELLPVLEAQRTRTEIRQEYLKALFDYHASLIDLETAIGGATR